MISDILFDALCEIRHYQLENEEFYSCRKRDIDQIRAQMAKLLMELDSHWAGGIATIANNPVYQALSRGDVDPWDKWIDPEADF